MKGYPLSVMGGWILRIQALHGYPNLAKVAGSGYHRLQNDLDNEISVHQRHDPLVPPPALERPQQNRSSRIE